MSQSVRKRSTHATPVPAAKDPDIPRHSPRDPGRMEESRRSQIRLIAYVILLDLAVLGLL